MREVKAVIGTAGFGSRFFPYTAAVGKAMLPIGNRPVVDYLVQELAAAGVREIAFVVQPGDDQIRRYFEENARTKRYFEERGWTDKYAPVARLHADLAQVRFTWIEQPQDGRYGSAMPGLAASGFIGDADWFLLSGDDVVLRADGGSDLRDMRLARHRAGAAAAIQVTEVSRARARSYGMVRLRREAGWDALAGMVEKPQPGQEPTLLANISRYLLGPELLDRFARLRPDPHSGEYQTPTAILDIATDHPVLVHRIAGEYHDCGTPDSWLEANLAMRRMTDPHSKADQ
ncbi:sugar phosphate nucleotidyltransferase [Catellatospora chokoriensis]|uniref:UTP--glucose-1-phosphate uridylyltransferase n=1 Tax=Catellatospora chokoriensis TaxID=310353 RepID=A0A8J3JYW8_9ACTN|nr:sugar phosphate nucleotidyltransferase [Catellatospora chokoriensis]GIF87660.1 UTP--glucose-1-phosphate uridylyltransferase [Catellatospora chokoriensis]